MTIVLGAVVVVVAVIGAATVALISGILKLQREEGLFARLDDEDEINFNTIYDWLNGRIVDPDKE